MRYNLRCIFTFIILLSTTVFIVFKFIDSRDEHNNTNHHIYSHHINKENESTQQKDNNQYFVSTKAHNATARCGPGTEYDIFCTYARNTPLLVIDSHENWRLVVDFYGEKSWMHISLLSTRNRYAMCKEDGLVYTKQNIKSKVLCRIQKYTVVHIVKIHPYMCRIDFTHLGKKYKGYIETENLFGACR